MVMVPSPGMSRTRATDSLRRPTEMFACVAIVIVPYCASGSVSGFCAACGCLSPA